MIYLQISKILLQNQVKKEEPVVLWCVFFFFQGDKLSSKHKTTPQVESSLCNRNANQTLQRLHSNVAHQRRVHFTLLTNFVQNFLQCNDKKFPKQKGKRKIAMRQFVLLSSPPNQTKPRVKLESPRLEFWSRFKPRVFCSTKCFVLFVARTGSPARLGDFKQDQSQQAKSSWVF